MALKSVPYNFTLPREILDKLKEESKKTGVPVSSLIKISLKKYMEEGSEQK